MGRVYPEVNGQVADPLVGAGHPISLVFNFLLDGVEVHELLALTVQEFAIF